MGVTFRESGRAVAQPALAAVRGAGAKQAVWAATVVAAGSWGVATAVRESLFLDKRQDLGNYTQALWTTAHGHFLQVTETGGTEVSQLGIHVDPIIAFLAPLWWLWPSPLLLLTVQAAAVALGAIPLFWLGRKHLPRERDAALLSAAYLLSPTVSWNVTTDFHPVALAVPLLLFAIWYIDEDRFVPFAVTAGAAMLCQEQIGLMVGCLGLWHGWRRRRPRVGVAIALAGFGISALDFLVVLRHFSGGSPYAARFGGSPTTILRDFFTHPLTLGRQINGHDLLGLWQSVPVLGLCFGSTVVLVAMPQVALLLLSRHPGDWDWFGVNVLVLTPFIFAATVFTIARIARMGTGRRRLSGAALAVFAASLVVAIVWGPFSLAGLGKLFPPNGRLSAEQQALKLVPADARVSATNHLALPLAARRYLYVFPVIKSADWVVVDYHSQSLPDMSWIRHRVGIEVGASDLYWQPRLMRRDLRALLHSRRWQLVYERDDIYVFRRART